MKTLIVFALVLIATVSCSFNLPMVMNIGSIYSTMDRIEHSVKAAGPFVLPRNVTFHFEMDTGETHYMYGVRIRGTEPRYDVILI